MKHLSPAEIKAVEDDLLKLYRPTRGRNIVPNGNIINNDIILTQNITNNYNNNKKIIKISNVDQLAAALGVILIF